MHEVDVIGLMTSLKQNGKAKLSEHFKDAEVVEPVSEEPKAETKPVTLKRKVTLRKKSEKPQPTAYSVVLMPAKSGGEWPKLYGFKSEQEARAMADRLPNSVSASWDYGPNGEGREKKERYWLLKMGKRYCGIAKGLCAALNAGDKKAVDKVCADSHNVYELAKADGQAAREEAKAAKAEKKSLSPDPSPSSEGSAKTYTAEDVDKAVADALKKVLAGGVLPENVKKLMAA